MSTQRVLKSFLKLDANVVGIPILAKISNLNYHYINKIMDETIAVYIWLLECFLRVEQFHVRWNVLFSINFLTIIAEKLMK